MSLIMSRKFLFCSAMSILLGIGFTIVENACVAAATLQTEASTQPAITFNEISDLVKQFFPKSKIIKSEKSLHFEFKAHERLNSYSNKLEMSPDLGGIIGDVEIKPGASKDNDKLPTERHETIHSLLLMAPYSAPDNSHLATRLVFQPDTPNDFMLRFREIVNSYKKGDVATAAPSQSAESKSNNEKRMDTSSANPSPSAAKDASASTDSKSQTTVSSETTSALPATVSSLETQSASPQSASPQSAANGSGSGTTFGAAKMSKYSYPEGRFRVYLPGSPQMKYTTQAGLRMVDYAYPEAHGTFNISYVILPQQLDPAKVNLLTEKISQSVITSVKGANVKQSGDSLQSFPGRQLDIGELKDKPGQSARFRLFVVRRYVYVIGVAGKKSWINSPIANEFLSSFNITPELTAAEQIVEKQREFERQHKSALEDADRRHREFDQRFAESQSRARKEHEKFKADFENNRWRR